MDITVKRIWRNTQNPDWTLKARVDVDLAMSDGTIVTINGVTVNQTRDGKTFVGMPQVKGTKVDQKTGKIPYYDIVKLSKEAHYQVSDAVLAEYGTEQGGDSAPRESRPVANTNTRQKATVSTGKTVRQPEALVGAEAAGEEDPPF
jgi:DNA-binding cell septation regulator SpoVG